MWARAVIERGLATREEVAECVKAARADPSKPLALVQVLMDRQLVTMSQLRRIKSDNEGERSAAANRGVPGYQLVRKLGAGAMAVVYLARQVSLDRMVAIKFIAKKHLSDPMFVERFYKEGRAAAKLNHPHIVGAYDVGQAGEQHYFIMEYVDGDTVFDRMQAKKRLPEHEALAIIRQVALALEHAHERGFVHRDIKPKNLMITATGVVKLADLGLARAMGDQEAAAAETGKAFGTPYYISPEQIRGLADIGPPADLYGLGATFYHMLTGKVPFEGKNPNEVMQRHLKDPLVPPDHLVPSISNGCAEIVEMMMTKSTRDRYQSAKELIEDIDLVMRGEAPHHARKPLDVGSLAAAADDAPTHQELRHAGPPGPLSHPISLAVAIGFVLSVLVNGLLLYLLLSK
jgi:serine/threonine-protein kinase